jgi:leucyl aminopeptidase
VITSFELVRDLPDGVGAVAVGVASGGLDGLVELGVDPGFLAAQGFEGAVDQVAVVPGGAGHPDVIAVGLGPVPRQGPGPAQLRRGSAAAVRAAARRPVLGTLLLDLVGEGGDVVAAAQAVAEGAALAGYHFGRYRATEAPPGVERLVVVGRGGKRVQAGLDRGARIAEGVALARDLVNTPGGELTPEAFAQVAVEVAEREDLQVSVLDVEDIIEAGLGGLLGVNRGSNQPPRFVELTWEPASPRGTLALVGKGITFDSGGLSIKSMDGMMWMKDDMAGAAAVLGAFSAMSAVAPRCRVRGYLPLTDNMSGGDATRPGDVLQIRGGKTVEVLNTDAEGRLVLADALALASEAEPDAIVDLATLTGAVEVALGNRIAGLMGNDQGWVDQVRDAAGRVGEQVWQLPLPPEERPRLDSDVADLRNIPKGKGGGTITAGLFLQEFVGEGIPWAHLDIAGTAWRSDGTDGEHGPGGTGWGVRTLLELARTFRKPARG